MSTGARCHNAELRCCVQVSNSKKSIGALIMDQSFFTGPGNIYRAEILFKAGVHPEISGKDLTRPQFDRVWFHTVELLRRGFQTGSILTVDPEEARALGKPKLRRYAHRGHGVWRSSAGWTLTRMSSNVYPASTSTAMGCLP